MAKGITLKRFKVTDFRSVKDSGWIEADPVTALIGVNESGKTNLLLPLWKFKPAKEGEIEPTADYPKKLYGEIRAAPANYTFVTAEFDLGAFAAELARELPFTQEELATVRIWRTYDGKYWWHFPQAKAASEVPSSTFKDLLETAKIALASADEMKSELGDKARLSASLVEISKNIPDQLNREQASHLQTSVEQLVSKDRKKTSALYRAIDATISGIVAASIPLTKAPPTTVEGLWKRVWDRIPSFVYYSNYGNLDSEIYLPHVVENLARTNLGAKEAAKARTLRVLFKFVRLDAKEILELGREFKDPSDPNRKPSDAEIEQINLKKKERSILLQSASTSLTQRFKDWWKQGDYRFRFEADGNHFRIWVSDDRRPEEVELEGRSTGLQWFLSFYLVFLVESEGDHKNAILLLDEPGLSLHPLAQRDLSQFFNSLSGENQLLYTTHSPFLVDADTLERARKVYVDADGTTRASSNLREPTGQKDQKGAAYAVHSALNLNVSESLLQGCIPVVVEGPSDQYILTAIKTLLIANKKVAPQRELVFPPAGGAKSIKAVSAILTGRDEYLPMVLVDDDSIGRSAESELRKTLYVGSPAKVLNLGVITGLVGSEIEDLVPPEMLVDVLDRFIRLEQPFSGAYASGKPILPQVEAWAAGQGFELKPGWKVELAKRVKARMLDQHFEKYSADLTNIWTKLFTHFEALG